MHTADRSHLLAALTLGAAALLVSASALAQTSGRTARPVDDAETKPKLERVAAPAKVQGAATEPTPVVGTPAVPQRNASNRSPEQVATGAGMGRAPSAKEAAAIGAGRTAGAGSTPNPVGQGPAINLAAPPAVTVTPPDVPRTVDARAPGQPSAADLKKPQVKSPVQVQVLDAPPIQAYLPILEPQDQQQTQQQGLTSSSAPQTQYFVPVGAPHVTARSGERGGISKTIDLYSPQGRGTFISSIAWMETGDRPCSIWIEGVLLTTGYRESGDTKIRSEEFGCGAFQGVDGYKSVRTDPKRPIAAIQVCNNNNNNLRMKGLKVAGKHINPSDASAVMPDITDQASLSNCRRWGQTRSCPTNMRATGLVVHAKDAGGINKAGITGLQLICREIAVR